MYICYVLFSKQSTLFGAYCQDALVGVLCLAVTVEGLMCLAVLLVGC